MWSSVWGKSSTFLDQVSRICPEHIIQNGNTKWHIKDDDKIKMSERKKNTQEKMGNDMGLRISIPKQNGSGNSNDGNTARRAFAKCNQLSSITGLDETLLNNLHIILLAIPVFL